MVDLSEADEQIDKLKKNVSKVEEIANAIADLRQTREQMDNITLTLDYPSKFVIDTDSIFSVIHNIQIDNESINLNDVTNEEFVLIT